MHAVLWGYLIAAIMGAIVSSVDLFLARDKGIYLSVTPLCLLYILFDVATSLILFAPLNAGAKLLQSNPTEAAGVTAGLIATLLMRTKITVSFLKGRPVVNAVAMLRTLQIKVGVEINERCAVAETNWILDKVLPSLAALTLEEVEVWAIQSLRLKFSDPKDRSRLDEWVADIRRAAADDTDPAEAKRLIVQILQDTRSRRLVIGLMSRAKRERAIAERTTQRKDVPPHLKLSGSPAVSTGNADPDGRQEQAAEARADEDSGGSEKET